VRIVLDTNVWVSGFAFPEGPPGRIVEAVRTGEVRAHASWALAEEIVDVLGRPSIRELGITPRMTIEALFLLSPLLPDVEGPVPGRDAGDARVVSSAIASAADFLVTGDKDLLDDAPLRALLAEKGIEVLTPAELLRRLPPAGSPRRGGGGARRSR
jgi:putative PIN family toxin of toxin-antitoxin system